MLFLTLGSLITIIVKKTSNFTISKELYLPDLVSIVVTVLLAFYIGYIVEKNKSNERIAKDTVISYYKEYDEFLNSSIKTILSGNLKRSKINSNFKTIRTRLYKLEQIATSKKILNSNNLLLKKISDEVNSLWRICTGDISIIDPKTNEAIELRLITIDGLIYELILEINEK